MKRKRVVLISIITFLTFLLLGTVLTPLSYTAHTVDVTDSVSLIEDAFTEDDPPSLILNDANISLNERIIPAETAWLWAATNTLYADVAGTVDTPSNLGLDDSAICTMTEELVSSNYRLDLRFRTASPVYTHRYNDIELRLEFSQAWSLYPEDLQIYVCLATSSGTEGSYTFVDQYNSASGAERIDISEYLFNDGVDESRYIFIRVLGAIEASDPLGQNTYYFDFLGVAYHSHVPYLDTSTNGWDSAEGNSYLYPHYGISGRNYAVYSATFYCYDGGSELSFFSYAYHDQVNIGTWTVTYTLDEFHLSYSDNADSSWVSLVPSACSISTTATLRIFTFGVLIEWTHPRGLALSTLNLVTAGTSEVQSPEYDYPFPMVYPGLSMQTSPTITESQVPRGATCTYSGDLEYTGSDAHWSPLASEVDIQVRRTSPLATNWIYTAQPASDGTFTTNPSTASSSGTNTFELKVVADGESTNLLTTTYSDTVVGDRVVVSSGSVGSTSYNAAYEGGVRNTGQADTLYLELEWESSGTAITSATTVSWASSGNTISMSYISGRWEGNTYARSSVGELNYNDLSVVVDGTTYEVDTELSYSVLWDEIEILTTVIEGGDDYINIGDSINIRVTAQLSYLGHALDPGFDTLYMNGVKMSDGGAYFTYTVSHSYPGLWMYSVDDSNALENTYGITKIATGKPSVSCTWDTFSVALEVVDAHVSIGETVRVWAHVTRAYDSSVFTDSMGSVVLRHTTSGDISMTYSSADGMWYADVTQNSVNKWVYFIYSITDTTEQIDTVGRGLNFDGNNDYVDCGLDLSLDLTSTLTLSAWFYGDGVDWGSGMYLLAKKDNNNAQYSLYIHSDGTLRFVYYNGTIREIDLQSGVTRNTWHHVIVTISGTNLNCWYDGVHVRENIVLPARLVSFPSVPLYLGAQKVSTSTSYHLNGFISEVRIYDYVLSEVECKKLYCGEDPDDFGMLLYLGRASVDTSADLWNDLSGFGNDGTIHDAVVTIGNLPMNEEEEVSLIWDAVIISITNPTTQILSLGLNASGIIVTASYAFDGLPFDGIIQLNNTLFSYFTPGQRGYTVSSISGDSYGISVILLNDETYAIWVLQQAILHLNPLEASILVSTIYDPQNFSVDVYLTDAELHLISGWVNLTIDGEDYVVFCDGIVNSIFYFVPTISDIYTLEAFFEGDSNYSATETSILLTADPRDIVFTSDIPSEMTVQTSAQFNFLSVYDNNFLGDFEGVTYIHNFPSNASFSIWWTISSDYGNPRTFTGTWNITVGDGIGLVTVPWDLDGNGWLNSADFISYFVIHLDGLGIYENITIETPVIVLQPLEVNLQVPTLTYSDQSTLNLQLHPLYDPSFTEGLDLTIALYVSNDNSTWVSIGEFTTTTSGWQSMNWTCTDSGTLFFKVETMNTELYTESIGYVSSAAMKETTVLTIEGVGNFTYSDQGVLVALLSTDDGEPLSDQTAFLELLDGTWISIGSGLTNASGHVSILWIPTLPADTYSIQIRMSLAGSQYFLSPDNALGQLRVSKELIVISIDFATASQGFIRARVTDDDGTPIPSIQVHFYSGSNHEYRGTGTTDNDGYTRLNITLSDGEILEAVVNEDNYYFGAQQEVPIAVPADLMFLGTVVGAIFMLAAGITISRKIIRGRRVSSPPSVSPEVSRALEEERDSIPERVREHSEKRLAELDGLGGDSGESSETLSFDEDGI